MKRLFCRGLAPLIAMTMTATASAQSSGYAITPFDPSTPGSDWYTTESLDLRGTRRPQLGLMVDWAYAPLVAEDATRTRIITDQVNVHLRAGIVMWNRFRFGVSSPLTVFQHGDAVNAPGRAQAPGDLRLDAQSRIFGEYGDAFRCGAGLEIFTPLGRRDLFTGDQTFRFSPRLLFAGDLLQFAWAAKLAYVVRPFDGVWQGRELGDQVTVALSAGVQVNDRFVLGPEIHGAGTIEGRNALEIRSLPIELLVGGRIRIGDDLQIGSAIGGRITDGDGAAKMRVLAILEYATDVCVDKDGDGICAYEDACPLVDGPRTQNRRTNGCPVVPPAGQPAPKEPNPKK